MPVVLAFIVSPRRFSGLLTARFVLHIRGISDVNASSYTLARTTDDMADTELTDLDAGIASVQTQGVAVRTRGQNE